MTTSHIPRATAIISVAVGAGVMGDAMLYAVLPANMSSFGVQIWMVGVILSVNRFVRLISNAWAGAVYERMNIFWPFIIALIVGGLINVGYAVGHGFRTLVLLRLSWGVCWSFIRLGGYLTALEEGTTGTRGRLMGILNTGGRAGQLVGALLGAILADLFGYSMAFSTLAFLTGLGAVVVVVGWGTGRRLQLSRVIKPVSRPRLGFIDHTAGGTVWNLLISHIPDAPRQLRYRLLAVSSLRFALGFGVEGLLLASLGLILLSVIGEEANLGLFVVGVTTVTGAMLAIRWFSDIALSTAMGYLSDRFGRSIILAGFFVVLPLGLLVVGFSHTLVPLLLVLPAVFIATTAYGVVLDTEAGDLAPPSARARVMGRYSTWRDLGEALGPLVGYALGAIIGFEIVYLIAALIFLPAGALYFLTTRRR